MAAVPPRTETIEPGPLIKRAYLAPASKSYANRLLVLSAMAPRGGILENVPACADVVNMVEGLRRAGVRVDMATSRSSHARLVVAGGFPWATYAYDTSPSSGPAAAAATSIAIGDGGTTLRFLLPLLALSRRRYAIHTGRALARRPVAELFRVLRTLGVTIDAAAPAADSGIDETQPWLCTVGGPVSIPPRLEAIDVDCGESTQFLSGMALALSGLRWQAFPASGIAKDRPAPPPLRPRNLETSLPYWRLTQHLIDTHGSSEHIHARVPPDFSSFGYFAALAAFGGEILLAGMTTTDVDPWQADSRLVGFLSGMGASCHFSSAGLRISCRSGGAGLHALAVNLADAPDLAPTVAFLAAYASGLSCLTGLEVLRHKESRRGEEISRLLALFDVTHHWDGAALTIVGRRPDSLPRIYEAPDDHRMVMSAALFMRANGGGEIRGADAVVKSYPDFFHDLRSA